MKSWIPYAVGGLLVAQFAALGVWQVGRGFEKRADQEAYDSQSGFAPFVDGMEVEPYQRIEVEGVFDAKHQFLLDNIIVDSRYGHYVLTPLVYSEDEPVLIVNRGWVERSGDTVDPGALAIESARIRIKGRVGAMPRAAYRMGDAFAAPGTWPQHAVYPTLEEVAAALGTDVQPFVLLMDPEAEFGFVRQWLPEVMGPGRHYAYAFQWFAMGIVLAALLVWNYRKRSFET